MKIFAQFISFIFNPLAFMLLLPYFVVFRQTENTIYALKWQLFSSVFVFAAIILFFIGKWRGIFSDHDISKREERPKFYFIVLVLTLVYLGAAIFFKGIFSPLSIMAFGICVAVIALSIVNYRIKASGHVAVVCAFVITMGILYGQGAFMGTVWIIPLIAWSRLILKRHTIYEIVVGGVLGTGLTLLTLLLGKYMYSIRFYV